MQSRFHFSPARPVPARPVPARAVLARRILACLSAAIISTAVGCGSAGDSGKVGGGKSSPAGDGTAKTAPADDSNQAGAKQDVEQKVLVDTSLGKITVLLDGEKATLTVNNFLRYVDDGHYGQTIFHEVSPGYAVLGGGYTRDMTAKKTRTAIRNEAHNGLKNLRGTIAMVRRPDVIDSATCQFLFNLSDNPGLDHKDAATAEGYGYCVFGRVIDGMEVLDRIGKQKVHEVAAPGGEPFQNVPVETVMINSVRRVR